MYQYLFGIQVCSILAECWKSSKNVKIARFCSFYWICGLINPHSTHTTRNKHLIQIVWPFSPSKDDKILVLAQILFLSIFPIFPIEIITLKCIGGADVWPRIVLKLDCHHMFKYVFCHLHDVSYQIWKDNPFPKGGTLLALNARSPLHIMKRLILGQR